MVAGELRGDEYAAYRSLTSKYYVELGRIGVANLGRWHEVAFDGDYKVEFSAAKGTGPRRPSRQTKCACGRGYVTVNRK